MTLFRMRILTLSLLVFAALPALAQDGPAVNPNASLGCLLAGFVALAVIGLLAYGRESQSEQVPTVQPTGTSDS